MLLHDFCYPEESEENEMNIFHLSVEDKRLPEPRVQQMLVIAASLFEAVSVVPEDFSVKAIRVQIGTAVDASLMSKMIDTRVLH